MPRGAGSATCSRSSTRPLSARTSSVRPPPTRCAPPLTRARAGDQISLADLHLAAWLTRLATLSGATGADDGEAMLQRVEAHVGGGLALPRDFAPVGPAAAEPRPAGSRLAAFWDAVKERPSWKKVYKAGIY